MIRLDQFVASSSGLSRKDAKRAIGLGKVTVNNAPARSPSVKITSDARVELDGQRLSLPGALYLMLHKPAGYVSATRDADHPTVFDLLPADLVRNKDLHIAGRLDLDTTGLLLLTTDGQWSHRITSPRHVCHKVYRVELEHPLDPEQKQHLEQGVLLNAEEKPTRPARISTIEERVVELTISEGRYHQVKRMMAAVGNHVIGLHRQQVGDIELEQLEPGEYRKLTQEEIDSV